MKTRSHVAHYCFLALATLTLVGCNADRATAPTRQIQPRGVNATTVTDLSSYPAPFAQTTESGQVDYPGDNLYMADDFDVPQNAEWTIYQVGVTGQPYAGTLSFSIRADNGGQPGEVVANSDVTLAPTKYYDHYFTTDLLYTFPTPVKLTMGKYWLTITVNVDGSSVFAWEITDQVFRPSVISEDGFHWGAAGHDHSFAIFATIREAQSILLDPVTPNPAPIGSTATVHASTWTDLPVALSAAPSAVCTLDGATISYVGLGTCTITANQAGDNSFLPAPTVTQDIIVVKRSQTITFPAITPNPAIVSGTATLGASASSGLAMSYSSLTTDVCTTSGGTVSYKKVGTCTLAANQTGNGTYDKATQVTQSVKVAYRFDGFLDPIKNGGVMNSVKAGQTITLQWRLTDANGAPITSLAAPRISVDDLTCSIGSTADQIIEQPAGGSGLQSLGNGYYQYNWKSPASYAKSCKTLKLDLGEGTGDRVANFAFTK